MLPVAGPLYILEMGLGFTVCGNVRFGSIADLQPGASRMSAFGGKADVKNKQNCALLRSALCQKRTLAIKTCQRPAIRDNVVIPKKLKNVNGQNITQKAKRV